MSVHIPDHFSSKFKINLSNKKQNTDRVSLFGSSIIFICGILLLCLGAFELYTFLSIKTTFNQSLFIVEVFASITALVAIIMIINSLYAFIRYKKIRFDGKTFRIVYRPSLGVKICTSEPLENYMGVRMRMILNNNGLINKNKYIIDLYHKDKDKIVPLFISTKGRNIRKKWEEYAKLFKLPTITISERGLIQREYKDLNLSIIEQAKNNKLPILVNGKLPAPKSILLKETTNHTSVKQKSISWDKFNTIILSFLIYTSIVISICGYIIIKSNIILPIYYWIISTLIVFLTICLILKSCKRYKLYIESTKIVIKERLFGILLQKTELQKNNINNIELSYNPTVDKYCLAITTNNQVITFGNRLPVNDLLWLKDFIIRKLIGN